MKTHTLYIILVSVIFSINCRGQEVKINEFPTFVADELKTVLKNSGYVALFQVENQKASELRAIKGRIEQVSSIEYIQKLVIKFSKPTESADSIVQVVFIGERKNGGYLIIKMNENKKLFLLNKETGKPFELPEIVKMIHY